MALKRLPRSHLRADVTSPNDGKLRRAAIAKVNTDGSVEFNNYGTFLINPSTIEDNKSSNWSHHTVPGQSDQVLQWISSGPREVSFDALVTRDTSYLGPEETKRELVSEQSSGKKILNAIGGIAAKFFKVPAATLPVKQNNSTSTNVSKDEDLSIAKRLDYYRSLLYPTYFSNKGTTGVLKNSPPLVVLYMGSTLDNRNTGSRFISSDNTVWVVTNLRIKITKQLPNLAPMEAIVSFQLTQYTIRSVSSERFG
jgi:hypothetical protein